VRIRILPLRIVLLTAACWAWAAPVLAQDQGSNRQSPDVVRVNTSLVQTDVMVFDKQGAFVDGLRREQFALKVDGKPSDIAFFERVQAGSRNEEAQLFSARGNSSAGRPGAVPLDRGRTVFFFIDDIHLAPGSMTQARTLLQRFIDREMGQNDEAAIASSSGQIGFLQQLTDDKTVLRAATGRLKVRSYTAQDAQRPPISEYQALLMHAGSDDVLTFFVDELMRLEPTLSRSMAAAIIQGRASQIAEQAGFLTNATLNSLKALVKNAGALPGRKLVFLVSDGFLLDNSTSDSYDRLRQVTSAAAAAGVVIYSIDARGLTFGMPDASAEQPFDPAGRLSRAGGGEQGALQNGLHALAVDTGGRAFFNSNDLSPVVTRALKETSAYYLLAWRPENDEERNQRPRRIEVSVNGRPDLVVRLRRTFGEPALAESSARKKNPAPADTRNLMREVLRSPYPKTDLPVAVSLHFLDLDRLGATLTASIKISTSSLLQEPREGPALAELDVAGGVYDDRGKPMSSFNKHLTMTQRSGDVKTRLPDSVFYNHFCVIKPGLYQVRIAAVDSRQGRTGSAVRWIEIPDLESRALTLSSLSVGENKIAAESQLPNRDETEAGKSASVLRQVSLSVDHHFASSSRLRFLTFVYNAMGSAARAAATAVPASSQTGAAGPDLAVQVQLFRDNEPVMTTPLRKVQIDGTADSRRLPYAAQVSLDGLQPGRYVLLVTVIDRLARASAAQRFGFQVD